MIRFYLNRELSQLLGINLAKWKRWSREFLPPDPLGGMQSGFARQYSVKDAFIVYLGGHLVSDLKISIPETKQILSDLDGWLNENGFYGNYSNKTPAAENTNDLRALIKSHQIMIEGLKSTNGRTRFNYRFNYRIRGIIAEEDAIYRQHPVKCLYFTETHLSPGKPPKNETAPKTTKQLNITEVSKRFHTLLNGRAERT